VTAGIAAPHGRASPRRLAARIALPPVAALLFSVAATARAEEAAAWLARVGQAARQLSYAGTIVTQHRGRVETSRIVHLYENGREFEKLVGQDGPAWEMVRTPTEVRYYYPDSKLVRVEPRTVRNVFPALSAEQQKSLAQYYSFRTVPGERIGGHQADVAVFEPKDGMRYGHQLWSDTATGLLLKARVVNERGDAVAQFAFTELTVNPKIDRAMIEPSWPQVPPDWQVKEFSAGGVAPNQTGWTVARVPPGFTKIMEGLRRLPQRREPVAQLVFSDGLVAISVFVEPFASAPAPVGMRQDGGLNVYTLRLDDNLVTVIGEAPAATVRQIGNSVARR
jgi:sigma-E factor negative regulatory protein RseB